MKAGRTPWLTGLVFVVSCQSNEQGGEQRAAASSAPVVSSAAPTAYAVPKKTDSPRYRCLVEHDREACCAVVDPLDGEIPYACCKDPASTACQYPEKRRLK